MPIDLNQRNSTPRIGVKWSAAAVHLLDQVDLIEVPAWDLESAPAGVPLLLHNIDLDFSLALPGVIDQPWLARANSLIARTRTPWLSLHLGMSAERVRFAGHMLPVSATLPRDVLRGRILGALESVKAGIDVPLVIENLDYCPEGAYEHVCEPEFISEILESVDCGLLLDIAHARVSADWFGIEIGEYLGLLPLDRVVEVHLSSPRPIGERLDDAHRELTEVDIRLFGDILAHSTPNAIVLEYTRDEELLESQLRRIRENVDASSRR